MAAAVRLPSPGLLPAADLDEPHIMPAAAATIDCEDGDFALVMCNGCDCALYHANERAPMSCAMEPTQAGGPLAVAVGAAAGCGACPLCDDVCLSNTCRDCDSKRTSVTERKIKRKACKNVVYTMCQVARHNRSTDCWLVAHGVVYDATPFLASQLHPAGNKCILQRAGQDCSKDFDFHIKAGQKIWKTYRIGNVVKCRSQEQKAVRGLASKFKAWLW